MAENLWQNKGGYRLRYKPKEMAAFHYRAEQVTVNLKGLENMLGLKTTVSEADQIKGLKRL